MMILNYSLFYLVNNVIIISKIIIRYNKYVEGKINAVE